jgi:hypothetical protein
MLAPVPSMEFESEIPPDGNPDSGQKQHALKAIAARPGRAAQMLSSIAAQELTAFRAITLR